MKNNAKLRARLGQNHAHYHIDGQSTRRDSKHFHAFDVLRVEKAAHSLVKYNSRQ